MKATVVTGFIDEVTKVDYNVGDPYPTENVDKERLDLLTKPHPKTGKVYVYIEETPKPTRTRKTAPKVTADE